MPYPEEVNPNPVLHSALQEASADLYAGSSHYGDFAYSMLTTLWQHAHGHVQSFSSGTTFVNLPGLGLTVGTGNIAPTWFTNAIDETHALLNQLSMPFDFQVVRPSSTPPNDAIPRCVANIRPVALTVEGLQRYLTAPGRDWTPYHGALGKALTALKEVTGRGPTIPPQSRLSKKKFVSYPDFKQVLDAHGHTSDSQARLMAKISQCLSRQVSGYDPKGHGEVIVIEGDCRQEAEGKASSRIRWGSIAVDSVVNLADHYHPTHNAVMRPFLAAFNTHYESWRRGR